MLSSIVAVNAAQITYTIPSGFETQSSNETQATFINDYAGIYLIFTDEDQVTPEQVSINLQQQQGYEKTSQRTVNINNIDVIEEYYQDPSTQGGGYLYTFTFNNHDYTIAAILSDDEGWDITSTINPVNQLISSIEAY